MFILLTNLFTSAGEFNSEEFLGDGKERFDVAFPGDSTNKKKLEKEIANQRKTNQVPDLLP